MPHNEPVSNLTNEYIILYFPVQEDFKSSETSQFIYKTNRFS